MNNYLGSSLPIEDHLIAAVLDGYIVKKGDTELCDLTKHMKSYGDRPRLQVYKAHFKGEEYVREFYNYREAVSNFLELSKGF